MNKIMIILLHSMQFRRMEEWRISDWGTGKNLEGIRPATWRGTNKRILWTRLGRVWFQSKLFSLLNQEESIIVAKLKRNTPFHACMRIYTCVCVCICIYTCPLTNCESSHASATLSRLIGIPMMFLASSHLPSFPLPTTWMLRNRMVCVWYL